MSDHNDDESALDRSEELARSVGLPFDREKTRELTRHLHDHYFRRLLKILPDVPPGLQFDALALRTLDAFISGDDNRIVFDEQIDFWLMTCAQLNTIAACFEMEPAEYQSLVKLFGDYSNIRANPFQHEELRKRFWPYLNHYGAPALKLSHALSRSMILFIICHEIAHARLGHLQHPATPEHEWEADATASDLWGLVIDAGESAADIFVSPKIAGAPILMMRYLDLAERYHFRKSNRSPSRTTHPSPLSRATRLRECLRSRLQMDTAAYLLNGFERTLDDLIKFEDLPEMPS